MQSYNWVALLTLLLAKEAFSTFLSSLPPHLYSLEIQQKFHEFAVDTTGVPTEFPEFTNPNHSWAAFPIPTWTNGFFSSALYLLDTRAKLCNQKSEIDWVALGRLWSTDLIALETLNETTLDHNVGFLSYPFQKELLVDPKNVVAQAAVIKLSGVLADRFNPLVGCTRSWNTVDLTDFQVIIDNMMNLELLFIAADLTGNQTLRNIAITHADTTMKNQFRPDGSTWNLIDYNSTTGAIIHKGTALGLSDNSTWTRGQSWAIYGYANMFQRTGFPRYLGTARRAATLYANRLPENKLVPWDFDAPPPTTADTSSAAIAASGMLLLGDMEESLHPPNKTGAMFWRQTAIGILTATDRFAWAGKDWQSLLSNGTVDNRASPPMNDTGVIHGDYFWIESGNRLLSSGLVPCPVDGF